MTKTILAINFFQKGNFKQSLSIFKTFKIGFTKSQIRTLEIASDCYNGNNKFYSQIGIDPIGEMNKAIRMIKEKYNLD